MQLKDARIEAVRYRSFREPHRSNPPETWLGACYRKLVPWIQWQIKDSESWLGAYYQGLLRPFHLEVDEVRLAQSKSSDFMTMATEVMHALRTDCALNDVDLFLMAHQTMDTCFPVHFSATTLICREFGISAPALALSERKESSPYIALQVLLTALAQEHFRGSALLLVLDRAILPYNEPWDAAQKIDTALAIKLTTSLGGKGTSVNGGHYWADDRTDRPSWVLQCLAAYLGSHDLDLADVSVVTDDRLGKILATSARLSVADARYMSCAGLLATVELLDQGSEDVLLAHLGDDGHLYLFLFRRGHAS